MKSWAYLLFFEIVQGEPLFRVQEVKSSESKPAGSDTSSRQFGSREGWFECPHDIGRGWLCYGFGNYFSPLFLDRARREGPSALPQGNKYVKFRVYNFFGMDNYSSCDLNIDVQRYGIDDVSRILLSYYKGGVDLGIRAEAGDPDGKKLLFKGISQLVYSNFSSVTYIDEVLRRGNMDSRHFKNLLWAVVSSHTVAKVPEKNKVPLADASKPIIEYNLDPMYPIVARWQLESGPRWGMDWCDIGLDFIFDFVTEVVDAAV